MGGQRISWIDAVKGLAVFLVIYAHALPSSPLVDIINTFHVPLFVVITGYLIGDKEYTKERAIQKYTNTFLKNIYKYIFLYLNGCKNEKNVYIKFHEV